MSTKQTYVVAAGSDFDDITIKVTLEVDTAILTPALATEINSFWTGADSRLATENEDVVRTVVRLFGARAIGHMAAEGGANFYRRDPEAGSWWTAKVLQLEHEGWPSSAELGIAIVEADVNVPGYDDVTLEAE